MPHDRRNRPVKVGDRVVIHGRVTEVQAGEDYCNLTLETEVPMQPSNSRHTITLNAGQVELSPEAEAEATG